MHIACFGYFMIADVPASAMATIFDTKTTPKACPGDRMSTQLSRRLRRGFFALLAAVAVHHMSATAQPQPANASFETPVNATVGRTATPAGATWGFVGTSGIEQFAATANGAGYVDGQAAYLSAAGAGTRGKINQTLSFAIAESASFDFRAARV